MKHAVVVASVDMGGGVDGFLDLTLQDISPPIKLTCLVVDTECAEMTQEQIKAHFRVGRRSIWDLRLDCTQDWQKLSKPDKALRQPKVGAVHTVALGRVIEILDQTSFSMDCGPLISVECSRKLPEVGQWINVQGTLIGIREDITD